MLGFLFDNIGTIVICLLLSVLLFLSVRRIVRDRKRGGCAGCSHFAECSHRGDRSDCDISNNDVNRSDEKQN